MNHAPSLFETSVRKQKVKNAQTPKGGNRESPSRPERRIGRTPFLANM
jgi:hypothetical protein